MTTTTDRQAVPDGSSPRPDRRPDRPSPGPDRRLAVLGAAAAAAAVTTTWAARWAAGEGPGGAVYVSQLGAAGSPVAGVFNAALLVLALGGLLVAGSCRGLRSTTAVLSAWSTATPLVAASAGFAVASRVPCTAGCPVPLTPGATGQDLVHVVAAVVGFAAAVWAMLQVGWGGPSGGVRTASRLGAVLVGLTSGAGGLCSLLAVRTDLGAHLEFAAMTVAVLWLVVLALHRAARPSPAPVPDGDRGGRRPGRRSGRGQLWSSGRESGAARRAASADSSSGSSCEARSASTRSV